MKDPASVTEATMALYASLSGHECVPGLHCLAGQRSQLQKIANEKADGDFAGSILLLLTSASITNSCLPACETTPPHFH